MFFKRGFEGVYVYFLYIKYIKQRDFASFFLELLSSALLTMLPKHVEDNKLINHDTCYNSSDEFSTK